MGLAAERPDSAGGRCGAMPDWTSYALNLREWLVVVAADHVVDLWPI
jgi:hypothetical protein